MSGEVEAFLLQSAQDATEAVIDERYRCARLVKKLIKRASETSPAFATMGELRMLLRAIESPDA